MKWIKRIWYTYLISLYNDRLVDAVMNNEHARIEQLQRTLEELRDRRDSN